MNKAKSYQMWTSWVVYRGLLYSRQPRHHARYNVRREKSTMQGKVLCTLTSVILKSVHGFISLIFWYKSRSVATAEHRVNAHDKRYFGFCLIPNYLSPFDRHTNIYLGHKPMAHYMPFMGGIYKLKL